MSKLDYDIVMLALPRWDGLYSSTAYSLAQSLSQHTRVFYIDNPFTVKDVIKQRNNPQIKRRKNALWKGKDIFCQPDARFPNLIAVTPRVVLPINWLPAGKIYDALSKVNDRIMFDAIKKTLSHHNVKRFVFINSFNPLFGRFLPRWFKPLLKIYHCVDDISKSEYVSKHGTRLESEVASSSDLTLTTSMELKRLKLLDSPHVHYLPNAANVELFQQVLTAAPERPAELKAIPDGRKIIFYMGNICHRIDYDLLKKIVDTHSDKTLVMVGPLTNEGYKRVGLDKAPNVVFTGSKKLEQLPAYVHYSDCCIIPFLCNTLTKSIYPLKINEYLSAGKPVVTTNFSADIATFGDVAMVSNTQDEFVTNISNAIAQDTDAKRRERVAYSSRNNWTSRAEALISIVQQTLAGR